MASPGPSRSPGRNSDRRSKHRDHDRNRDRDGDRDRGEDGHPPSGVDELHDEDDYFRKATELKLWLWEEKHKRLDSLRTDDARRYFRKFCRAWNRGDLAEKYYAGISPASLPAAVSTAHSWSFSRASQADLDAAASIRKSIDTGSKTRAYDSGPAPAPGAGAGAVVKGPTLGPAMPPPAPPTSHVERLQLERDARDAEREAERAARASDRRRSNRDAREDERDQRATGRDRVVEKRREGNAARRAFEGARESGGMVEVDDETLMGGGGFDEAVRERERQQRRREDRKGSRVDEKKAEVADRYQQHKAKEDQTMAMFKQLAAQRFGGS
ncbi:hypothetical protein JCM8202v2_005797 [Rhodotorula sphaerocarpa]